MFLYQRIAQQLRADLISGRIPVGDGDRLPPERVLQREYQVSRPTIAKAIRFLADAGLLATSSRLGTRLVAGLVSEPDGAPAGLPRRIGFVAPFSGSVLSQRMMRGIGRAASRRGYSVLMACSGPPWMAQERAGALDLVAAGSRGLVITPAPRREGEAEADYLNRESLGVPVVLTDMAVPYQGHTQVLFDNERAAYEMTSSLIGSGARRIAILGEPAGWVHASLAARRRGYLAALRDHAIGVDDRLLAPYCAVDESPAIADHIDQWYSSPDPPQAIIAQEDIGAMEVIDHLEARGLRCPEDVRVLGFDNREEARRFHVPFPTTNPSFERMGEIACGLLIDQIETGEKSVATYVLEVPILHRRR
jgi:DNA-binding LacI/PurR family transcriptional regulator